MTKVKKGKLFFSGCEWQQGWRSEIRLGFSWLQFLLLPPVEDDADDVPLVLLHVLHQPLLAGGLEATDAAAEEQHAVLCSANGGGSRGRLWLSVTVEQQQRWRRHILLPRLWSRTVFAANWGLTRLRHRVHDGWRREEVPSWWSANNLWSFR